MKVLKLDSSLMEELEKIALFLGKIEKKRKLAKTVKPVRKSIFEIKKSHDFSQSVEFSVLNSLLLELHELLRHMVLNKVGFQEYVLRLNRFAGLVKKSSKNASYDFFKLCGNCANCCISPRIFSFEHAFIKKYRKHLKRKGLSYVLKNNPKTGRCVLYNAKTKKCGIYNDRPLDCTFFPFTFIVKDIAAPNINAKPRKFVFLCRATKCDVSDRLSLDDSLEVLGLVSFALSKIPLEEAKEYSNEVDPRQITFELAIPYDERKTYHDALKKISAKIYTK